MHSFSAAFGKGLAGVVETIGGFLVLFVTQRLLDSFILFLTAPELALLTVFDLVVAFLIWREYQWRKT
jgi:uncharacterized membrane protein